MVQSAQLERRLTGASAGEATPRLGRTDSAVAQFERLTAPVAATAPLDAFHGSNERAARDLARDVHCVFGIPIDVIDFSSASRRLTEAAHHRRPYLFSTPNLNFLVNARRDVDFRTSLLLSDLCPADGMVVVWLARLLGIPLKERVAGADVFQSLRADQSARTPLRVFLMGGDAGIADKLSADLNASEGGLKCVGALNPGYGDIEEMSRAEVISQINACDVDLLAVSLGAKKGQAWLLRNHDALQAAVRVHLGATFNFETGAVKRAPLFIRRLGLEWLWRSVHEPRVRGRYAKDGLILLWLLVTQCLPLAVVNRCARKSNQGLTISASAAPGQTILKLAGVALARDCELLREAFEKASRGAGQVILELSELRFADSRVLGLVLMLRKRLSTSHICRLRVEGVNKSLARLLKLNGLAWLADTEHDISHNSVRVKGSELWLDGVSLAEH